jgi:FkbM family methyltransferase
LRDLSEITAEEAAAQGWPPGGDMAWDVGANTGMTLPLLTALYRRVIAFEPAAESFAQLSREWAHRGVTVLREAVADHDGTLSLAVRTAPIASGQLVAPGMQWDWGTETGRRDVPCVTLDTVAAAHGVPDFVKIDTEGGELKALQGAGGLLAGRATCWMTEFHALSLRDECERIFADAGYDVQTFRPARFTPGSAEWLDYGWMKAVPSASD